MQRGAGRRRARRDRLRDTLTGGRGSCICLAMAMPDRNTSEQMSHVAMAALAGVVVVTAALTLMYVSRHAHQHPGAVLVVLIGVPALIALIAVIAMRRRPQRSAD